MATKVGATKGSGKSRRKWNGKRWVSSPVRTTRTPATRSRAENRRSITKAKPKLGPIPASKRPKDMQAGKVYGDAGQPKAPKLPPKPSPKPAPKPSPKPAPKAPAKKPAAPKPAAPKAPAKRKPRTWLKDNYKPGVKGIKSARLSKALSNLKVRDYKKKK